MTLQEIKNTERKIHLSEIKTILDVLRFEEIIKQNTFDSLTSSLKNAEKNVPTNNDFLADLFNLCSKTQTASNVTTQPVDTWVGNIKSPSGEEFNIQIKKRF